MSSRPSATAPRRPASSPERAPGSTVFDHVARAAARLVAAGLGPDEARGDTEVLARHVLGWDRAAYLVRGREVAPPHFADRFAALVDRRGHREPVAYLTGSREFWGLEFAVTPAVLIPRPETELVVEAAVAMFAGRRAPTRILDVGTGSGCLAVALAREFAGASVVATDRSEEALAVARLNAARLGVADRVRFVLANLLAGVRGGFDLVVCNPPYIATEDWPTLPPDVRRYEPRRALDGGPGGLAVLHELLAQAPARLAPGGALIVEIGAGQEGPVRRALETTGWRLRDVRRDLQGWPRVVVAGREPRERSDRRAV